MASNTEESQNGDRNENVPWYSADLKDLSPAARQLLETYSNIPPNEVIPHILAIRDRAWKTWQYPCIGQFRFLDLSISASPSYPLLLDRLKNGHMLLDLGCCFGQDIRKLVADGAPAYNLFGSDLHQEFLDLGFELFRDRETLTSKFFASDVLVDGKNLEELDGKIDIIHVASFFHLFSLPAQIQIAKRLVKLLRPVPSSLIFGRQTGNVRPGKYQHGSTALSNMWRHDVHTWEGLWAAVSRETGTQWKVEAKLMSEEGFTKTKSEDMRWRDEGDRSLRFEIWRV